MIADTGEGRYILNLLGCKKKVIRLVYGRGLITAGMRAFGGAP